MDSGSLVCGSRVQGSNLRRAMVWYVSQAGLNKDHYSSSHTSRPGDSGDVQPSTLLVPFDKSVVGEALNGCVHLDGRPLTRFTVGVNKIAGARGSVPVQ